MSHASVLRHILSVTPDDEAIPDVESWWARHLRVSQLADASTPIDRALLGGFAADRLGYAFVSGYHEALCQLTGGSPEVRRALCATEEGGAHPRAIACELRRSEETGGWVLRGRKRWTTLGKFAQELLVVAREPSSDDKGRPRLAVVRVASELPGVVFEEMPPTPFAPEIPHVQVALADVALPADARLPGDGYADYLKPFRTVEDIFVSAAAAAWCVRVARRFNWPTGNVERIVAAISGLQALAAADPRAPAVHVALAGLLEQLRDARVSAPWQLLDDTTRARWERDRALLEIASRSARAASTPRGDDCTNAPDSVYMRTARPEQVARGRGRARRAPGRALAERMATPTEVCRVIRYYNHARLVITSSRAGALGYANHRRVRGTRDASRGHGHRGLPGAARRRRA